MLQTALLGHALPKYLFINKVAASIITVFTSFGLLFYPLIASTPFPTVAHSELRSPSSFASRFGSTTNARGTSRELGSGWDVSSPRRRDSQNQNPVFPA